MNSKIQDYIQLVEGNNHQLKAYALRELFLLNYSLPFQKLTSLYSVKEPALLDEIYHYTTLYDEHAKNQLILEHLNQDQIILSDSFLELLSSFTWNKELLKNLLKRINDGEASLQKKLILKLSPYRFLLPQHFLKKYAFSKVLYLCN